MAKPNRGKTETIKERTIYVYLLSIEIVNDWKRRAEKAGVSISKFVVERVEDSIKREEGDGEYLSRLELIECQKKAQGELKRLREDNELLRKLVDNLDRDSSATGRDLFSKRASVA